MVTLGGFVLCVACFAAAIWLVFPLMRRTGVLLRHGPPLNRIRAVLPWTAAKIPLFVAIILSSLVLDQNGVTFGFILVCFGMVAIVAAYAYGGTLGLLSKGEAT